ncbi:cytochrome P450 CYP82D47-like [Argentina anserina]|uniref:cytochrome P450 CYP82D47-like n=1 Tax=Argentina anserina TaxID=57926 RepID=UPI002176686F|nr:cytochrome P450 CYP82D47-like [Potentilla anserina]
MEFLSHLLAITGILVLLFLFLWRVRFQKHKIKGLTMSPEPYGALPIIGHLHQVGGQNPLHRTLATMADKYGPIFTIWLGRHRTLVINNYEAVKECFTTNDRVFATRPASAMGKHLGFNYAVFALSPYGKYWRDIRKLVVRELLSSPRLETLKHVHISEVDAFVKGLYSLCKNKGHDAASKVMISELIEHLTLNVITKIIAGKKYFGSESDEFGEEEKRIRNTIKDFMHTAGRPVLSDVIRFPESIDFTGQLKRMKNIGRQLDSLTTSWVEEHHTKKQKSDLSNQEQDFIDVLLAEIENGSMAGHTKDTIIKSTAITLVFAGSETTATSLTWILSLLLNNRHTLKIAQEELDQRVGRKRWVADTDIKNLVYLQAIVKEALRLYPPSPLALPHEAMEDCKVGGFHIPKGTHLYVNIWKLHRNPSVWPNPEVFSPERFLTSHAGVDASGHHFEFIPFGSGRRVCPGITFAFQVVHLTVARLIQGFELATPLDKPVDMTEGFGISMPRATDLEIVLKPRLAFELYPQ